LNRLEHGDAARRIGERDPGAVLKVTEASKQFEQLAAELWKSGGEFLLQPITFGSEFGALGQIGGDRSRSTVRV
jgi:hypothetical protein